MLFALRRRRAPSEKAVICFYSCLYQVLSLILTVSLPPSACLNPLCRHPPPSSEGGEGAPAPRMDYSSALPSAGRSLPLFFCNQKKSRKTVKEKFRPLPSRSRVRLPPKGGINAPNIIKALVAPLPLSAHASASLFSRSRTAAVEIPRFILHRRRSEFLPDGVPGGFSVYRGCQTA